MPSEPASPRCCLSPGSCPVLLLLPDLWEEGGSSGTGVPSPESDVVIPGPDPLAWWGPSLLGVLGVGGFGVLHPRPQSLGFQSKAMLLTQDGDWAGL